MRPSSETLLETLLERWPRARQVFDWYGLGAAALVGLPTLGALATRYEIDIDDLIVELETFTGWPGSSASLPETQD
jgi:hypothetical protein